MNYGYNNLIDLLNFYPNNEFILRFINKFFLFSDLYEKYLKYNHNFATYNSIFISNNPNYEYNNNLINIQLDMYSKSKNKSIYLIINDYYCHSLLTILLANPSAHILFVLEYENVYTTKLISYIKKYINTFEIEYLNVKIGDIIYTIDNFKFDLIVYSYISRDYISILSNISNNNIIEI